MFLALFMTFASLSQFKFAKQIKVKPHLSVEAMEAIAKNSIVIATERLNAELAGVEEGEILQGY